MLNGNSNCSWRGGGGGGGGLLLLHRSVYIAWIQCFKRITMDPPLSEIIIQTNWYVVDLFHVKWQNNTVFKRKNTWPWMSITLQKLPIQAHFDNKILILWLAFTVCNPLFFYDLLRKRDSTISILPSECFTTISRRSISHISNLEAQQSPDVIIYPHINHTLDSRPIRALPWVNVGLWVAGKLTDG